MSVVNLWRIRQIKNWEEGIKNLKINIKKHKNFIASKVEPTPHDFYEAMGMFGDVDENEKMIHSIQKTIKHLKSMTEEECVVAQENSFELRNIG